MISRSRRRSSPASRSTVGRAERRGDGAGSEAPRREPGRVELDAKLAPQAPDEGGVGDVGDRLDLILDLGGDLAKRRRIPGRAPEASAPRRERRRSSGPSRAAAARRAATRRRRVQLRAHAHQRAVGVLAHEEPDDDERAARRGGRVDVLDPRNGPEGLLQRRDDLPLDLDGPRPGSAAKTSIIGTLIWGSSSRGVTMTASAPRARAKSTMSGVSFESMKAAARRPATPSGRRSGAAESSGRASRGDPRARLEIRRRIEHDALARLRGPSGSRRGPRRRARPSARSAAPRVPSGPTAQASSRPSARNDGRAGATDAARSLPAAEGGRRYRPPARPGRQVHAHRTAPRRRVDGADDLGDPSRQTIRPLEHDGDRSPTERRAASSSPGAASTRRPDDRGQPHERPAGGGEVARRDELLDDDGVEGSHEHRLCAVGLGAPQGRLAAASDGLGRGLVLAGPFELDRGRRALALEASRSARDSGAPGPVRTAPPRRRPGRSRRRRRLRAPRGGRAARPPGPTAGTARDLGDRSRQTAGDHRLRPAHDGAVHLDGARIVPALDRGRRQPSRRRYGALGGPIRTADGGEGHQKRPAWIAFIIPLPRAEGRAPAAGSPGQ